MAVYTGALTLAPTSTDRKVSHASTCRPIPLTTPAKMPWLVDVVVVVVTELCIHAVATWTWQNLIRLLQDDLLTT
jgi:hypothetical protein